MEKMISANALPLYEIFNSKFQFIIPQYQRPYSWTHEHTAELFDDLYKFYSEGLEGNYFLGSIVLIKDEGNASAEVIDGQQRLTTLTIFLAALASISLGQVKDELKNYILESGKFLEGVEAKPRLSLRSSDNVFFNKYVQRIQFNKLQALDDRQLKNEAEKNIKYNSKILIDKIDCNFKNNIDSLNDFSNFLMTRCYLVVVSTPDKKSSFKIFSVLNDRGLDLIPPDNIKAETIGQISEDKQEEFTKRWENLEDDTGREGFHDLFSYIRMIFIKKKAQISLLDEFEKHLLDNKISPIDLIENILEPYGDAYLIVKKQDYESEDEESSNKINALFKFLNKIDNSDWLPPAILFLSQKKNEPKYVLHFFKKLERLAAYLHICAKNRNHRIERYATIIKELEKKHSLKAPIKSIELDDKEKKDMMDVLNGSIYDELTAIRRNYIILRLDSFVADKGANYDHAVLTIEHVLPQSSIKSDDKSNCWVKCWPEVKDREEWLHRIANLIPLTRRKNSQAQNYCFDHKKSKYFPNKENVSSYALTTQVLKEAEWTPTIVKNRQEVLLKVFKEHWEL